MAQDEHGNSKERQADQSSKSSHQHGSGPVPLMALGDISPPDMHPRNRHHGAYQNRGRGSVPPRMQREESYSFRGSNRRGRGEAKPLMSLPPTDLERNEWHSDSGSEDESYKKSSQGSMKGKKDR